MDETEQMLDWRVADRFYTLDRNGDNRLGGERTPKASPKNRSAGCYFRVSTACSRSWQV